MSISHLRRDYPGKPLLEEEAGDDPIALFDRWFTSALESEPDSTAMTLATVGADGRPRARIVLLKDYSHRGFVFFTNYDSRKARDLAENPHASLLFFWRSLERQVRVEGTVEKVSAGESDAYFETRPIESRISVYASRQSQPVKSRDALEALFNAAAARFDGKPVPRPEWWGGYRLVPDALEFWQGRTQRLHDRLRYARQPEGSWQRDRLAP